ncbi:hypothetical protein BKA66DRAFT_470420 [Pyrenochaeta sp. MPI-SDFR-AT-0127]|nr:hypothetical protein BKA66DRAFT_470420 [Pyrenochaeta sp. MPI-SDFR-AT-0127]
MTGFKQGPSVCMLWCVCVISTNAQSTPPKMNMLDPFALRKRHGGKIKIKQRTHDALMQMECNVDVPACVCKGKNAVSA